MAVARLRVPGGGRLGRPQAASPAAAPRAGSPRRPLPSPSSRVARGRSCGGSRGAGRSRWASTTRFQARRGAHAALEVDRLRATAAWRGGVAGALDRVRRRAEVGLARGLPREEAALLRGMVLGPGRAADGGRADGLPAVGPRSSARGVGPERRAARHARPRRRDGRRAPAPGAAGAGARARRALRPARRRRAVDPARRGDGRRRARGRAGGPARVALVRARARGRGHARAQPAGVGRGRVAAVVRRRRRAARARPALARGPAARPACPGRWRTPERSPLPRRSPPRR